MFGQHELEFDYDGRGAVVEQLIHHGLKLLEVPQVVDIDLHGGLWVYEWGYLVLVEFLTQVILDEVVLVTAMLRAVVVFVVLLASVQLQRVLLFELNLLEGGETDIGCSVYVGDGAKMFNLTVMFYLCINTITCCLLGGVGGTYHASITILLKGAQLGGQILRLKEFSLNLIDMLRGLVLLKFVSLRFGGWSVLIQ